MTRPRIALATHAGAPDLAPDDRRLLPALAAAGMTAVPAVWSDGRVRWRDLDAVLIRSCWDYHLRSDDFLAWLGALAAAGLPVWNPPALVRWNADKCYLLDLERRGVPTVPTVVVPRTPSAAAARAVDAAARAVDAAAAAHGWPRIVLKPVVSASGFETHALGAPLGPEGRAAAQRVLARGDALVQPFVDEVQRDGELSFVFLDGEPSHAAVKRARSGEFRVQTEHGGSVAHITPDPSLVAQAARTLRALEEPPLYARVDGVVVDGRFVLMELELIEPNLFFALEPSAAPRLAAALARRLAAIV